jgi:hypothetical protein
MKLSLRDIFWLTAVIALAVGWWVEHAQRTKRHLERVTTLSAELRATDARLAEAEDLLEFEGVVMGHGETIHTSPEGARRIREERKQAAPAK